MPLCQTFIQVDSAVLPVLPFTAADDFCREVSRSYGAKEAFSLQASLCCGSGAFSLEKGRIAPLPLPRHVVRGDYLECLAM